MSIYYFDASAVVKRYVIEPGTSWIRELCGASDEIGAGRRHRIFLGEITRVEVAAAFSQKAIRSKEISPRNADDAYKLFLSHLETEYSVVPLASDLLGTAAMLAQRHVLRAYDAVQLALALRANDLLTQNALALSFVSGDARLLQAARAEGLTAENPFDHAD
jgi:hypothetical protein